MTNRPTGTGPLPPVTDPAHPNHRAHRSICKQIVEIRSQAIAGNMTPKQRDRLSQLIAVRDGLHFVDATLASPPKRKKKARKPARRARGNHAPTARHPKQPRTHRIEFRCQECRKDCWTLEPGRRFCDDCRDRLRTKKPVSRKRRRSSTWIQVVPSGIPGSGVRY